MAVDVSQSRQKIEELLSKKGVAVLATIDPNHKPYAATIYVTHDRLLNLYFITKRDTQKCRNLMENAQAAVAIHDDATQTTIQAEGTAVEVDPRQQEWVMQDIWKLASKVSSQAPPITQLIAGGYVIFRFSAPSFRLATFTHSPDAAPSEIFEVVHTQPA